MKRHGFIGDAHLKRYTRGSLADNKPMTKLDQVIFLLFVKGHSLGFILETLKKHNIAEIDEQQMFDIIRKVGLDYQNRYKKAISTPFDRPKVLFAEFVKGTTIQKMADDYQLNPHELFAILRKVGLLYAQYLKIY